MTKTLNRLSSLACATALLGITAFATAQRPQDNQDSYHQNNYQDHRDQNHHDNYQDHRDNSRDDWHFRDNDRSRFERHYRSDARRWSNRHDRPRFARGYAIPRNYYIRPVPRSYWVGAPPPPGYTYGYYDGYVVTYNPATRIIADVLDLATDH
ncbi:MAG TPA: hypothetical protein VIJ65_08080 [Acidobacteriaceae bacterium]